MGMINYLANEMAEHPIIIVAMFLSLLMFEREKNRKN